MGKGNTEVSDGTKLTRFNNDACIYIGMFMIHESTTWWWFLKFFAPNDVFPQVFRKENLLMHFDLHNLLDN